MNILQNHKIDITFHNEDARTFVQVTQNTYDYIFLDAFTPSKCPTLWTVDFFAKLYELLNESGMILTYSNSAAVRSAFLKNGFEVGKIYDSESKKYTGTVAVKNKTLLKTPLSSYDLGLINSRAGICYFDEYLNLDNATIIKNRNDLIQESELVSSSQYIKNYNKGACNE